MRAARALVELHEDFHAALFSKFLGRLRLAEVFEGMFSVPVLDPV